MHPVAAVQTEYSLWTRNPEVAVLDTCRELGIHVVASPARPRVPDRRLRDVSGLPPKDIRLEHAALPGASIGRRTSQLLEASPPSPASSAARWPSSRSAWVLARAPNVVPIPGTTRADHVRENLGALDVRLSPATIARLDGLINTRTVSGPRYNAATLPEIDTEDI